MYNFIKKRINLLGFATLLLCWQTSLLAQTTSLDVNPQQCVALTQGQQCYIDVELTWQAATKGDYCLYSSLQVQPVYCWLEKTQGVYSQEFSSNTNIEFTLKEKDSSDILASNQIEMAWIHKKKGQPRMWWRIF